MKARPWIFSAWLAGAAARNLSILATQDPAKDPRDFSWIQNWAAVGDSFVAGIGAGSVYNKDDDSYKCSRYDLSYVAQLNNYFPGVKNFRYLACSSANSQDVFEQINQLPQGSQDLIVAMAGGNDLCLSSLIWSCILSSQTTQSACDGVQATAQQYISSQLGLNLDDVLDNAVSRLGKNGILVVPQYARYFNDVADAPCHFDEDWVFPGTAGGGSLLLTTSLRSNLNTLVANANKVINQAVGAAQKKYASQSIQITTASWDPWLDTVQGRFCESFEKPDPTDPANKNAHFFKLDTTKRPPISSLLETQFVDNATAAAQGVDLVSNQTISINGRDPSPPACPKSGLGGSLPDDIGKIFHPTILGHLTLASFVGDAISIARAKIINAPNPDCGVQNDLTCSQKQGSKKYAAAYPLYSSTEDFCKSAVAFTPPNTANWVFTKTYYDNTPDSSSWKVQLKNGGISITFDQCQEAMDRILDGCDGNDPANPMNFKFGGSFETEGSAFSISPTRSNRVWPPYKAPITKCDCWYHVLWDSFNVYGGGWGGWDYGKGGSGHGGGLFGNMTSCTGSWPSLWSFEYYDQPDADGYEWRAKANSVIWIKNRCLQPSIEAAGGTQGTKCDGNG